MTKQAFEEEEKYNEIPEIISEHRDENRSPFWRCPTIALQTTNIEKLYCGWTDMTSWVKERKKEWTKERRKTERTKEKS